MITVLGLCLTMTIASSVLSNKKFPICSDSAVCSEIYSVSIPHFGLKYMNDVYCKCPRGSVCPSKPGSQTLVTDTDKWYGFCQPIDEIPKCEGGEIAEEVIMHASEFGGRSYATVYCLCLRHKLIEDGSVALLTDTASTKEKAKFVQRLICSEDSVAKRGTYRSRFYFYRK